MAQLTIQQAFDVAVQHHHAGRLRQAEPLYRQVLAQQPDHAGALHYLGALANQVGRNDLAIDLISRAIDLSPDWPEAHCNLGNALKDHGHMDQAIAAYRQAIALKSDFVEAHDNLVYTLHFHPAYDGRALAHEHARWNQQHAEPLKGAIQPHPNDRDPNRRLRIGYVSPFFRDHVVGRNLLPLLANHDKTRFEIVAFADLPVPDARTQQLRAYTDHWRSSAGQSDHQLAGQIRQERVDILVDLTLHMANNRLRVFARKPAPVQVTFAGYPGSTGLTTIDYRLSDPYLDPPGRDESVYSEQTVRLPDSFWCYDPLDGREIPVSPLPAVEAGIVTFGCLNNVCKVNDGVVSLWAQVLRKVEGSRLLLLSPEVDHRQRTLEQLRKEGIDPQRVQFAPRQSRQKYLELYHRIDLGMDSFPYNGHTTSLDSFWMGVPVVTLVGQTPVSRAGWCQLSNLGLPDLAAQTPGQFVQIAVDLAKDLPRLNDLRQTLRSRMAASPLMDAPKFARGIEAAYRQMWQKWTASKHGSE